MGYINEVGTSFNRKYEGLKGLEYHIQTGGKVIEYYNELVQR